MQDKIRFEMAKEWIGKLANGINPIDDSVIPDGDIVNNIHISRCLYYVEEFLENIDKQNFSKSKAYKFNISPEDLAKVAIVDKTGIAKFVREINKFVPENMKTMTFGKILNWLLANGYLEEVYIDNIGKSKTPTDSGVEIGISAGMKDGVKGPYWALEYNANAQQFILDNIYAIAES